MKHLLGWDVRIGRLEILGVLGGSELVIRRRNVVRLRVHRSVVAMCFWWQVFKPSGTLRVLVTVSAAGEAPYHLMPFPPPNHHGHDYCYDRDDNTGDFSHWQFAALVGGIGAVGVGRVVGSLGGIWCWRSANPISRLSLVCAWSWSRITSWCRRSFCVIPLSAYGGD